MKQQSNSQEKQQANKNGPNESLDRSGDGLRETERSVDTRKDVSARFQPMPLEACLDCVTTYDPNVNYANVLASLLQFLATRDAERTGGQAHPSS